MDKRSLFFVGLLTAVLLTVNLIFSPAQKTKTTEPAPVEQVVSKKDFSSFKKKPSNDESLYVLENDYQQLVFSSTGGALKEINLPFHTQTNQKSVIKSTETDAKAKRGYPLTAMSASNEQKDLENGDYYPLLRSSQDKIDSKHYALNIISEEADLENQVYKVKEQTNDKLVFETTLNGQKITKTYTLEGPYMLDLKVDVSEGNGNFWLSSGVLETELISNAPTPAIKAKSFKKDKFETASLKLPKEHTTQTDVKPEWIANSNGFFSLIVKPTDSTLTGYKLGKVTASELPSRLSNIGNYKDQKRAESFHGYEFFLPLKASSEPLNFKIFAGPLETDLLKSIDQNYSDPTGEALGFTKAQSSHGWFSFISEPFAKILLVFMKLFYSFTKSWGLSIILLTIALRVMLYPLNSWSIKSMRKMQEVGPQVTALQKRYKDDPKKAQQEVMALYKKKKANPLSGCLPMLIQMPFLIGMFDLLRSSFVLRGASFIPGWINNLTSPDVLFSWDQPLWLIGNEFHLLPVLTGIVMFIQQKMSSKIAKR